MKLNLTPERKKLLLFFAAGSGLAVLLICVRFFLPVEKRFLFLLWNLFLALIPLAVSTTIRYGKTWSGGKTFRVGAGMIWLLFLPNAPYVLTDWVHVYFGSGHDFHLNFITWLYVAVLSYAAAFISLHDIGEVLNRSFSRSRTRLILFTACFLCGTGIYMGRYMRFNTWDVLTRPDALLSGSFSLLGGDLHAGDWLSSTLIGVSLFVVHQVYSGNFKQAL